MGPMERKQIITLKEQSPFSKLITYKGSLRWNLEQGMRKYLPKPRNLMAECGSSSVDCHLQKLKDKLPRMESFDCFIVSNLYVIPNAF